MYDEFKSIYGETIMAKIFIVEDNPDIIHSTTQELNKWQHDVITVNNWQNIANEILATNPDLVLFDITLPTFDGFYWIQEVRKHSQVPIIVISAAKIDTNVMHAVAAGADDYIMKPFAMTVLLAKIQALLRRNKQTADAEEIMWDHNSFNPLTNILTNENGTAQLTPTEGSMLQVLLSHRNKTVSKEQLLQWLWQGGKYLNENTLNVNISRLRTKLSTIGLRQCIHTERGLGYRLVENNE
ncbi:response regulator transcription factor [Limosilactobacillus reuteri]|uniref:response regulator transcription factor n=1 Tax=Limosilactobacillus reuteri TaxID=1598 RepID=UPI0021A95C95|nr:response regulator transcription factor [Limosilactobacillus reuteri]MCT3188303.1 DNA-binding response regulator [Limosilactobacillus reuteri]MCT3196187.1 DNA-binding response regulator [Limosilactobacillus reuteri]